MISIITPCLNSKDTIRTTIESVISQNDCSIEYIVVDGGSTDGTLNIIREYADSIHLITGKDKSIADAMNKGIRASSGDIVGILNDDDVYHDGALAEVERVHRQHPNSVLHGDMDVVFPNSYLKYVARSPSNPNFKLGMVIQQCLCQNLF